MTVRVVSYNILVPIYGDCPEYYSKSRPEFLKTDYRWNFIQSQLKEEIVNHENTVICLQEICLYFAPKLELFFRRLNYTFSHNLYGDRYNDYMGVGIAIPVSMELNSISIIKIGDYIRSKSKPREKYSETNEVTQSAYDPWETAITRANTLVCLQVVIDGKPLYIGTYHMPCYYKEPDVMLIHSSVVKDLMFELAAGHSFILAGDFNFEPWTICYQAFGEKDFNGCYLPESRAYEISYQRNSQQVLKSAYREKNGKEPAYTTFTDGYNSSKYCETLDYIFFNGNLSVETVLELPDYPIGESYPDETHPSDHVMIAATFGFF